MHKLVDLDHPFFAPAWRRHLTVAVCVAWGCFELYMGAMFWAVLVLGLGALAQWQFTRIDWSKYDDRQ